MSREERRQYERMMRGMDRGPALPPAARARAERNAARRAAARSRTERSHGFSRRFWVMTLLIAAAVGYIGFSLQWPQPQAPYVGVTAGIVALVVQIGIRMLQRRADARRG